MKYRIVSRDLLNNRITPITIFFETKDYALQRMKEDYRSGLSHVIYDLQSKEEADEWDKKQKQI